MRCTLGVCLELEWQEHLAVVALRLLRRLLRGWRGHGHITIDGLRADTILSSWRGLYLRRGGWRLLRGGHLKEGSDFGLCLDEISVQTTTKEYMQNSLVLSFAFPPLLWSSSSPFLVALLPSLHSCDAFPHPSSVSPRLF